MFLKVRNSSYGHQLCLLVPGAKNIYLRYWPGEYCIMRSFVTYTPQRILKDEVGGAMSQMKITDTCIAVHKL